MSAKLELEIDPKNHIAPVVKATRILESFDLRTEASHVMSDLAARFDENVYLAVPDGDRAACLDLIESSLHIRVDPDPTEPPGISRLTMALRARREIDDRYQNDT